MYSDESDKEVSTSSVVNQPSQAKTVPSKKSLRSDGLESSSKVFEYTMKYVSI